MITIVIPCYNEEDVIDLTYQKLKDLLSKTSYDQELIFVDDGSHDKTLDLLHGMQKKDPCVRILSLSRNFGHQLAITAGIQHATGDVVVVIDADLQDPPEVILDMLKKWKAGYDVVYGKRKNRKGEGAFKMFTAKAFYRFINRLSEVEIPLDTGDFRLLDRKVVDAFNRLPEQDRFVRGMISWLGFDQAPVYFSRNARVAGKTKYPLRKMLSFALDGILSFSNKPLRMAAYFGFLLSGVSFLAILIAIIQRIFTENWVTGWTSLFISLMFFSGVQLITLGIIGEYIGRIYRESKNRTLYFLKEKSGFPE